MDKKRKPLVLFYDVETTPIRAYVWKTGKQFVSHDHIVKGDRTKIICIAYKWEHEKRTRCLVFDIKTQNCDKIIEEFSKIVEKADVAIAHNGDGFDVKQINTQRLMARKPPICWPTTEDSLKQLRQIFYFPSFRLDYIAKTLLNHGKSPMAFQDWVDIVEHRSKKALRKMVKYCKRDVDILAEAYGEVKPFLKPKVNRALITKEDCDQCGSSHAHSRGTVTQSGGVFKRFQCQNCGHVYKSSKAIITREKLQEMRKKEKKDESGR